MQDKIQAIILAGGKGTRLAPLTDNLPKPLVPLRGKPIVQWVMDHLKSHGITRVALSVAHLGEMVETHYGDGSGHEMEISYLREPAPMGTAGWTQLVNWDELADPFLVLNADNVFWVDLPKLLARHGKSDGATVAAVEVASTGVSSTANILLPDAARAELVRYVARGEAAPFLASQPKVFVSSGWYAFSPSIREYIPAKQPIMMEEDVWPALAQRLGSIGFYHATEPWFDSGTHERLREIEQFIDEHPT